MIKCRQITMSVDDKCVDDIRVSFEGLDIGSCTNILLFFQKVSALVVVKGDDPSFQDNISASDLRFAKYVIAAEIHA